MNKTEIHFSVSEFCITPDPVPQDVIDKITFNFIIYLNPIREKLNIPIEISQKSGYRPYLYERQQGRPGTSAHTFSNRYGKSGMGAADLTCANMKGLAELLVNESPFKRIAYYPDSGFVHIDYEGSVKSCYIVRAGRWVKVPAYEFLDSIK